jgi:hypothetical protein
MSRKGLMLSIARLFAVMLLGVLALAWSSAGSSAHPHHVRTQVAVAQGMATNAGDELAVAKAECDQTGMGLCCSPSCGPAFCSAMAFPCSEAPLFGAALRAAFSAEAGLALTPSAVIDLLKPPQAIAA